MRACVLRHIMKYCRCFCQKAMFADGGTIHVSAKHMFSQVEHSVQTRTDMIQDSKECNHLQKQALRKSNPNDGIDVHPLLCLPASQLFPVGPGHEHRVLFPPLLGSRICLFQLHGRLLKQPIRHLCKSTKGILSPCLHLKVKGLKVCPSHGSWDCTSVVHFCMLKRVTVSKQGKACQD